MKKYVYLPVMLAACLSLTACIDDLIGDDEESSVSQADINYAKDFTRKFNDLDASMSDMEQPMEQAVQQFKTDTENLNKDAMAASIVALAGITTLALNIVESAAIYEGEEVVAVDYSQFNASYSLATLINDHCQPACDEGFDLTSEGTVSYENNQLTINDVLVTVGLYEINETLDNGEWLEERGDFIGQYDNRVSFTITLPDETLNNNNEVSISISNVLVESEATNFSLGLNRLGIDTQFDSGSQISLNDFLNTDEETEFSATSLSFAYELDNVELVLDQARFNGNFNVSMDFQDDDNDLGRLLMDFSVDGTLTNSLGEHILAKYSVNAGVDNNESNAGFNIGAEIELTFHSQSSGDLTLAFKLASGVDVTKNDLGEAENLNLSMLNEIKIISGENGFILSYGLDGQLENSDIEPEGSVHAFIKIQDASRSDKDFYIIINLNVDASSQDEPDVVYTSGVYVDDALVGKWDFDQYENTQTITFSDEVIVLGESSIGAR